MAQYEIEGMSDLLKTISELEKLPEKCVTKAAKAGSKISLKSAKSGKWIDQTGNLRKGIIQKGEKKNVKGKKVYDTMMNPAMNDVFQKNTATGMRVVRKGNKEKKAKGNYYYPASQEFGFRTRNGKYIPGFNFLKKSLTENKTQIENEMVDVLSREIDKIK